jgi:hypothetical protein
MVYIKPTRNSKVIQETMDDTLKQIAEKSVLKKPATKKAKPPTTRKKAAKKPIVEEAPAPPPAVDFEERERIRVAEAAEQERREQQEAFDTVCSNSVPVFKRIQAAKFLGFTIAYRGPEDRPRKIILRRDADGEVIHTMQRIQIVPPRGKNRRRDEWPFWEIKIEHERSYQHA